MRKFIFILCWLSAILVTGQSIPPVTTYYSKTANGGVGKDKITFHLLKEKMHVTDEYYGTTINKGTLELHTTRFTNDGLYCEEFRESADDFYRNNGMVAYNIY